MHFTPREPRVSQNPLREIRDGYLYSWNSPQIRVSLMLVAVSTMFGAAYLTMMPAFARDILHRGAEAQGYLMSSIGGGALVGAYFLSRITEKQLVYAPVISAITFGIGLIAFSHSHILWLSLLLLLPTAASLMLLGGTTNTIIQMVAHEDYRGRVISHYTQSFMGMMPWGALFLGTLATRIGVTNAVSIGGGIVILGALVALINRRASTFEIAPAE
jgi:predicted MFS family arabinose efflux permease